MRADNELLMTALSLERGDIVRCPGCGGYHRRQAAIAIPVGTIDRVIFIIQHRRHDDGEANPQRDASP
jgi:hypothetical protein